MKLALAVALGMTLLTSGGQQQEAPLHGDEATLVNGGWYVSSDSGTLIRVASQEHCSAGMVAPDRQTILCQVFFPDPSGNFGPSLELDVFHRNGSVVSLKPAGSIADWRVWNDGAQVALDVREKTGAVHHDLYDTATGALVQSVSDSRDKTMLPQWAKNRGELDDESVPESEDLIRERELWIAKAMREIAEIQPGTKRKDIFRVLTTEGGLSTRTGRTYVYRGCPYIKVRIAFKPVGAADQFGEGPDDEVESVSRPYLAWVTMD